MDLEGRGIPSVYVATTEFREASQAQAASVGFDPAVVYVPHPIQDRTEDEIRALAREAADTLLAEVTAKG